MSEAKRHDAGDDGPEAKRQKLRGDEVSLDGTRCLKEAEIVQDELDKINDDASDKVLAIEQEYNRIRRPVYLKRNAVLQSLPLFWKTALMNHPIFKRLISSEDSLVLEHLVEIDLQEADDIKSGFKMIFKFSENPYITNKELVKDIRYDDDGRITVHATPINWTPSKNQFQDSATFMSWVSDAGEDQDASLAENFKDELWPNPVKFFTGDIDTADLTGFDEDEDEMDEDEGDTADEEDL